MSDVFVGFDSAWTDNARAPGAICAVRFAPGRTPIFHEPRLARFAEALAFVDAVSAGAGYTLIGLDQPTIVFNAAGMRPAERVAASVVSWIGGGVQPANRGKTGMFCAAAPIWPFLAALGARDDPLAARTAAMGRHVMEVFPALALASLNPQFGRRLGAPKYNPANARRFTCEHWRAVCATAAACFDGWKLAEPAAWCRATAEIARPRKPDQDRLDAVLCLVVALHWRRAATDRSIMIGDLEQGYIVAPASPVVRDRLIGAARRHGVAIDGTVPG